MRLSLLLLSTLLFMACAPARAVSLVQIKMVSSSSGWAIGAVPGHYTVCRTTDGGRRWMEVSPPGFARASASDVSPEFYDSVGGAFADARRGWVAAVEPLPGDEGFGRMHVWRTGDGGGRWRESRFRTSMVGDSLYLQFLDQQHGVLLALGGPAAGLMAKEFYLTGDGGRTWQHMTPPDSGRGNFYPTGMTFRTPTDGWITATYHGEPDAPFLHTRDGGRTWHQQQLPIPSLYQGGYANTCPPQFFGREKGVMLADLVNHTSRRGDVAEQAAFVSHDGGAHWRMSRPLPMTNTAYDDTVGFSDARHGWVLDQQGRGLYETGNGGRSWRLVAGHIGPATRTEETQLDFVSPDIGWALVTTATDDRQRSSLYQTHDGGRHWDRVYTATAENATQ